jgi:tyrosine-protein kinase Etk/Wzc
MKPQQQSKEVFTLIFQVVRNRKWLILGCLLGTLLPIVIYNEITPPVYEANTMLVFEEFTNPVDNFDYEVSKEVFFNNQVEEIKSYSFSKELLNQLDETVQERLGSPEPDSEIKDILEYRLLKLQKGLSANLLKGSNIIKISFQSKDPELCQIIANKAAEVLKMRNAALKKQGVGGVRVYIEAQVEQYKAQLDAAEEALRKFKSANNITSLDQEAGELQRRLTEAEVTYNSVRTQRGALEQKLNSLKAQLAEQKKDLVPAITDIGSPWAQRLRERLIELNNQYMELKAQGYPDDHPKMRDLTTKISEVKAELKEKALKIAAGEIGANPIQQIERLVEETVTLQIDLESLKARENELRSIVQRYQNQLGTLPDKEYTLAKLTRDRDVSRKIYLMLLERLEEAKISEADQSETIRIIDHAQLPKEPISPQKKLNLAVGILLGLMFGVALAFFLEMRHQTLDTPEDVESVSDVSVIGTIPNINTFAKGKLKQSGIFHSKEEEKNERIYRALITSLEPNTVIAESYRMLRSNLQFLGAGKQYKTIMATSLGPGDGKTTTLSNLAISFASFGQKTLLIDADLRIPQIHNFFGTKREDGVTDLLKALNELDEFVANTPQTKSQSNGDELSKLKQKEKPRLDEKLAELQELFQKSVRDTGIKNLHFMPSGTKMDLPMEFVSIGPLPNIFQKYQHKYNLILIDSAPLLLVDDTLMMSSYVDAVILVVHPNKYDPEMLLKAQKMLKQANANLIGLVFNNLEVQGQYKKYYAEYAERI